MNNKLRYIDLGLIEPDFAPAIWRFSQLFQLEYPVYFNCRIKGKALLLGGLVSLDKYVKVEKIPKDVAIVRNDIGGGGGAMIINPNILTSCFYYYNTISLEEMRKALVVAEMKVLKRYNMAIILKGNDLFFNIDNKTKKFIGLLASIQKNWICSGVATTFDFDSECVEIGKQIYKFDTDKFTKKEKFDDITDIIGGLHEINKEIDFSIGFEVAQEIAKRFDLQIEKSELTKDELLKMNKVAKDLDNNDWKLYGKKPKL